MTVCVSEASDASRLHSPYFSRQVAGGDGGDGGDGGGEPCAKKHAVDSTERG